MGAKPLLVSQRQVTAVLKGAAAVGVHLEIRIEGAAVRFIPCTPEVAPAKPSGVDKRTRIHL